MYIGLLVVLIVILLLPLTVKKVEDNLEIFLFIMGVLAIIISKSIAVHFILEILKNHFLYMITGAVLIGGFLFRYANKYIEKVVGYILKHIALKLFIFTMVIIIGLISSIITAIIAALFLVEIIEMLPISRKSKIRINIISCFSIGLGSILTPIGEPLSTIIATKLNLDFWYMMTHLGIYIIPAVIMLGLLGSFYGNKYNDPLDDMKLKIEKQSNLDIVLKAAKIFIFIIALDMLGAGFRPLVDTNTIQLDSNLLYWINMSSAVLDNATLAAAEISNKMTTGQINSIILGLLISGGMMIPGNIPNIISAGKLKIKSSEWMKFGISYYGSLLHYPICYIR
jgi:predicted cation transporter